MTEVFFICFCLFLYCNCLKSMVVHIHRFCLHCVVALWCGWEETGSLVQKNVGYQGRGRDWSWLGRGRGDANAATAAEAVKVVRERHSRGGQREAASFTPSRPAEADGISDILVQGKKWHSFSWSTTKGKAVIFAFGDAVCAHTVKKCLASLACDVEEKKKKKIIQLNEIRLNVYGDIFQKPLRKTTRLRRGRSWSALRRLAFGIRTDPLISLMLPAIKGLARITTWDSRMLHCSAQMPRSPVLKRKCERRDDKNTKWSTSNQSLWLENKTRPHYVSCIKPHFYFRDTYIYIY